MKRHSQINLRQGEFAYVQNYESILKGATIAFKIVAIALFLLSVSYGIKYFFYKRQIETLQAQFLREYTAIFPSAKSQIAGGKVTFQKVRSDAVGKLQKEIAHKKSAITTFTDDNKASPALVVLKGISDSVPKELKMEITLYQYNASASGGGKLILRGETDSYASAESVLESLKKVSALRNVESKQSGPKPGTDNKIIEFTVHADYAGSDSASPKA
jgi:hypothetical protein